MGEKMEDDAPAQDGLSILRSITKSDCQPKEPPETVRYSPTAVTSSGGDVSSDDSEHVAPEQRLRQRKAKVRQPEPENDDGEDEDDGDDKALKIQQQQTHLILLGAIGLAVTSMGICAFAFFLDG